MDATAQVTASLSPPGSEVFGLNSLGDPENADPEITPAPATNGDRICGVKWDLVLILRFCAAGRDLAAAGCLEVTDVTQQARHPLGSGLEGALGRSARGALKSSARGWGAWRYKNFCGA